MSCERKRTRNLQCFRLSNGMKGGVTERNNMKEIAWINQHFCLGQVKFEMSIRHLIGNRIKESSEERPELKYNFLQASLYRYLKP